MATIFIIHGSFGSPQENWFPWLKQELEQLGHIVIVPQFPNPPNQSLNSWIKTFEPYLDKITTDTLFVCHSIAPAFILSVLEKLNIKIKAAFFVSGFVKLLGNKTFDPINSTFVQKEFDWQAIKNHCSYFEVYHSDNDPYVPIECAYELANYLDTKPIIVSGAGHFNTDAGYTEFNLVLQNIKKHLS